MPQRSRQRFGTSFQLCGYPASYITCNCRRDSCSFLIGLSSLTQECVAAATPLFPDPPVGTQIPSGLLPMLAESNIPALQADKLRDSIVIGYSYRMECL